MKQGFIVGIGIGLGIGLGLVGFPLFMKIIQNIFMPPNQSSPPFWLIILIAIGIIYIAKNYKKG